MSVTVHQQFNATTIATWERFYRANFLNSLSGFKSTHLIGTMSAAGVPNLGVFHNVVHLGADPALIGFVNRPLDAAPHTLTNIQATDCYTMNAVSAGFVQQAHQTSAKYPENANEFLETGLTMQMREGISAPFVAESAVQYALRLVEVMPIKCNGTFLVIGEITAVWVDAKLIQPDGFLALEKAEIVTTLGLDGYYTTQRMARFAYAKPGLPPREAEE